MSTHDDLSPTDPYEIQALIARLQLQKEAARGQVLFAGDTKMKILSYLRENKHLQEGERRSPQTTGIEQRTGALGQQM